MPRYAGRAILADLAMRSHLAMFAARPIVLVFRNMPLPQILTRSALYCVLLYSLLVGLLAAITARVAGDEPEAALRLLVMENGQVIRGHVSLHGDTYLVTLPYGEIQVLVEDVQHVCHTLEEGYRLKLSAIRFGSAQEHLQLAAWCLDQGLRAEARHELAMAKSLDPRHPQAAVIFRRLVATGGTAAAVGTEEDTIAQPAMGAEELDALVRRMTPEAVESFTRTIQPLLVNSCSARACHGSAATNDFRLRRFPHGQRPPQRSTLRNLDAVMRWIDQDDPAASRLLYVAAHPHGSSRQAALLSEPAQQRLLEWIQGLEGPQPPKQVPEPLNKIPAGSAAFVQRHKTLHSPADSEGTPSSTENGISGEANSANPHRPQDPFDPDVFNRRYHEQ